MSCPRDFSGQPLCHITAHPHRPQEYFCSTCGKAIRFVEEQNSSEWFWFLMIAVLLVMLLAGCEKQANLLLIRIVDSSSSALNNPAQTQFRKDACLGLADAAKTGDQQSLISVNQEVIASDPVPIKDHSQAYALCHQKFVANGQGTYLCPALQIAGEMSDRAPNYPPVVVLQVQANEGENFCPETLHTLTKKIAKRHGKLVIVGSTNDGNTGLNSQLWQTLKAQPNTRFCSTQARSCVKESLQSIHN